MLFPLVPLVYSVPGFGTFSFEAPMRLYLEPHKIGVGVFGGWKLVEYGVNVSDYCYCFLCSVWLLCSCLKN